MILPHRVYLSGGGMSAIAHVGALQELSKHIPLKTIKEWMGVSAGSFVAMCIVIGFTLEELADFCIRFDFTNIKEYDSVPGWILHFGLDTGERLQKLVEACLHVKGLSSTFTFQECLDIFHISLRVIATDLNDAKAVIFSPLDTPNYRIADAVRASMSFPYYFQPFMCPQSGHYLVDGGVISNYPLFVLPEIEHSRTLSILINTQVEVLEKIDVDNITKIIGRPLQLVLNEKFKCEMNVYQAHCIEIVLGDFNILEFSFDEVIKNHIIERGRQGVIKYLKQTPKVKRRYSV